jgi:hypothetical protein
MNFSDNLLKRKLLNRVSNNTAQRVIQRELSLLFGGVIISKGLWPSRSPDLSPPNYYVGATLKTVPPAITHAVWINRKPTYPTSLPHFTHDAAGSVYEHASSCSVLYVACRGTLSEILVTVFIANTLPPV